MKKYNEISETSLKNHKERVFYEEIQKQKIVKISMSKTPDVKSSTFSGLKDKFVSDFSTFIELPKKIEKKPHNTPSKNIFEKIDTSIESVIKTFTIKEHQRYLCNGKAIISFIINSLNEIKPADVKNIY